MISKSRLCEKLRDQNFRFHPFASDGFYFFRNSATPEIYEGIKVDFSGSKSEAVYAYSCASVVNHGYLPKGLSEMELIMDVAAVPDRGWTIIQSDADAQEWENLLKRTGPSIVEDFVKRTAPELLVKTARARAAAEKYSKLSVENVVDFKLVSRVASAPGVCQVRDQQELYERVVSIILGHQKEIEPDVSFNLDKPLFDNEFLWRLQLLVSRELAGRLPRL